MLFGTNLTNDTTVAFTENPESCSVSEVNILRGGSVVVGNSPPNSSASPYNDSPVQIGYVSVPTFNYMPTTYYFCLSKMEILA